MAVAEGSACSSEVAGPEAACATVRMTGHPFLTLDSGPDLAARPGDRVEFQIWVGNCAPAPARDVFVESRLPDGLTLVEASGVPLVADGRLLWRREELPVRYEGTLVRDRGRGPGRAGRRPVDGPEQDPGDAR